MNQTEARDHFTQLCLSIADFNAKKAGIHAEALIRHITSGGAMPSVNKLAFLMLLSTIAATRDIIDTAEAIERNEDPYDVAAFLGVKVRGYDPETMSN